MLIREPSSEEDWKALCGLWWGGKVVGIEEWEWSYDGEEVHISKT